MKLFKKPMTWGGYLKWLGIILAIIAGVVGYALGFHKIIWDKLKAIKKKLW